MKLFLHALFIFSSLNAQADFKRDTFFSDLTELKNNFETVQIQNNPGCAFEYGKILNLTSHFTAANLRAEGFDSLLWTDGRAVLNIFWNLKQALRKSWVALHRNTSPDRGCVEIYRKALSGVRETEDYFSQWLFEERRWGRQLLVKADSASAENAPIDPRILKSGDILMSKNNSFTSSAISRLPDLDQEMSHISFVYVDPNTQDIYTIEAHIEIGSDVQPISKYLADTGRVRVVLLRSTENEALMARAAKWAFDKAMSYARRGAHIPYDFAVDMSTEENWFCSEVIYAAVKAVSGGAETVPQYQSDLNPRNRDVLSRLGVTLRRSFLPGDMETDPRFTQLLEWRNLPNIKVSRQYDVMLTSIYDWLNDFGYHLHTDFLAGGATTLGYYLNRIPYIDRAFHRVLGTEYPLYMNRSVLETIIVLGLVTRAMDTYLQPLEDRVKGDTGFALTNEDLIHKLNHFRSADAVTYSRCLRNIATRSFCNNFDSVLPEGYESRFHSLLH